MNYYQDNNAFFEPSIHNLSADGTGKTVSEFPIVYYSVARLWKLFGHHEYIYRAVVLLFFFLGLFAVYKLFEKELRDSLLAMILALFLFTSPTLAYYANNFLMDIPSLSLALMGLYFFIKFIRKSKNKYLYYAALFYAISGLLKISSLMSFMAILGLFFFELLNVKLKPDGKIFFNPKIQIIPLVCVLLIQVIWYKYAINYNNAHNGGIFLIGILPVWELSVPEIKETIDAIIDHIKWDYFRRETQVMFLLMFLFVMVYPQKKNRLYFLLTFFVSLGFLLFVILFFQPLKEHDYYTINLFILAPIVMLSFFKLLKENFKKVYMSVILRVLIIAFLIHNIDFCRRRMEGRFNTDGWQNELYAKNLKPLEQITPLLDSLGINKNDRVICLSDNSINISLYFLNQKGWTNYGLSLDSLKIRETINLGAKYLILWDDELLQDNRVKPFIRTKVGEYKNIGIYKL